MAGPGGESVFNKRSQRQRKILKVMEEIRLSFLAIVNRPVDRPTAWAGYRNKLKEVDKLMDRANKSWARFSESEIPARYKEGFKKANNFLRRRFLEKPVKIGHLPKAVDNLTNQTIADFFAATDNGKKETHRLFRLTQQSAITEAQINNALIKGAVEGTPRAMKSEVQKQLEKKLGQEGKVITTNKVTGAQRSFDPKVYADIVSRTRSREAQSLGTIQAGIANGNDLVRVSDHNTSTDICMPHEGQVYSISGDKSAGFPALPAFPPFHPSCKHVITPFIESPADTERGRAQRESILTVANRNEKKLVDLHNERTEAGRSVRGATEENVRRLQDNRRMAMRSLGMPVSQAKERIKPQPPAPAVTKVEFKPAKSKEAAIQYAKDTFGLRSATYGPANLKTINRVNSALVDEMNLNGLDLRSIDGRAGSKALAAMRADGNVLSVNGRALNNLQAKTERITGSIEYNTGTLNQIDGLVPGIEAKIKQARELGERGLVQQLERKLAHAKDVRKQVVHRLEELKKEQAGGRSFSTSYIFESAEDNVNHHP